MKPKIDIGCSSYHVGKVGGQQGLFLSNKCSEMTEVMRTINLALGLQYETLRPDRDAYVSINWDNISTSKGRVKMRLKDLGSILTTKKNHGFEENMSVL